MTAKMKRREFITLLGGAAAAWPLAARAQQGERMRRMGVFQPGVADDSEYQARNAAFLQTLGQLGWIVGRNLRIDFRWGAGHVERYRAIAEELVAIRPDVILGNGTAIVSALQKTTRTVPIVFANITDPVGSGLVATLARPGGNATGFSAGEFGFGGKWLELLKEIAPRVTRVAVLRDASPRRSASWVESNLWRRLWESNCARWTCVTPTSLSKPLAPSLASRMAA